MLEKPDLQDESIIACLLDEYGLELIQVTFLPVGAGQNTAVYRVVAADARPYFFKLRRGVFDETSVALPKFLSDQGIAQIIAPLTTVTGQLRASLGAYKVILYPFFEGHNAYETRLTDQHWVNFGTALKRIHAAVLPPTLMRRLRPETYSPRWRENLKTTLGRVEDEAFDDPVAIKLAAFIRAKRDEILDLVGRAEQLARALRARPLEFILCHSDLHAGNLLIVDDGAFYIVDWDDPILAPKERDLMFIGGGLMSGERSPQEEERLFYRGYGPTEIDPVALAYYRYERIIQDLSVFCEQLFLTDQGGQDREQSYQYLVSNFLPGSTIEIAYRSDKTLREG